MATTTISALTETTVINGTTVGPFDYAGITYKVTANTLGAFINTNAVTISATGDITGANLKAAGLSLSGSVLSAITTTADITGGNLRTGGTIISNIAGTVLSATGNNAGLELGNPSASNTPYIDFHSGGQAANDYDFRILASGGVSSVANGTGNLSLIGGMVTISGNLTVNSSGNATAIINGASNAVGNIGSSSTYFNQLFAQATTALYADLAEVYEADADYAPGTVVSFGGTKEVTVSVASGDSTVAGVISANPSYLMNNGLTADHRAIVALTGRVPTSVTGTVTKGAMMISAGNGCAQACATPAMGTVIGKALENFSGKSGIIEIVVGRM
jgi:hypothetical protein